MCLSTDNLGTLGRTSYCLLLRADASAFQPISLGNVQFYIHICDIETPRFRHAYFMQSSWPRCHNDDYVNAFRTAKYPGVNLNPIAWQPRSSKKMKRIRRSEINFFCVTFERFQMIFNCCCIDNSPNRSGVLLLLSMIYIYICEIYKDIDLLRMSFIIRFSC